MKTVFLLLFDALYVFFNFTSVSILFVEKSLYHFKYYLLKILKRTDFDLASKYLNFFSHFKFIYVFYAHNI